MATNFLNNLNYPIIINSSTVINSDNKEAIFLNSRKNRDDLNNISAYINQLLVPGLSALASAPKYPYDAVVDGISGLTIITYPEDKGNNEFNSGLFWKKDSETEPGRPCTIKESFDYLLSNLIDRIVEVKENTVDLTELWESIRCANLNLERLKKDSYGEEYNFDCLDSKIREWSLSKHLYEIFTQLTQGHDETVIQDLNSPTLPAYPTINWKIYLNDILDVSITNVTDGDIIKYDSVNNQWVNAPLENNQADIYLYDKNQNSNIANTKQENINSGEYKYDKLSTVNNIKFNPISSEWNLTGVEKTRGMSTAELRILLDYSGDGLNTIDGIPKCWTLCSTGTNKLNLLTDILTEAIIPGTLPTLKENIENASVLQNELLAKICNPIWNKNILVDDKDPNLIQEEESYSKIVGVSRDEITYSNYTESSPFIWNGDSYSGLSENYENNEFIFYFDSNLEKINYSSKGETPIIMLGEYFSGDDIVAVPFQILHSRGIPLTLSVFPGQNNEYIFNSNVICMSNRYFEENILDDAFNNVNKRMNQMFNALAAYDGQNPTQFSKFPSLIFREDVQFEINQNEQTDLTLYKKGNWEKYLYENKIGVITNKISYSELVENGKNLIDTSSLNSGSNIENIDLGNIGSALPGAIQNSLFDPGLLQSDHNKLCSDILRIPDDNFISGTTYWPYIETLWTLLFGENVDKLNTIQRAAVAKHSRLSIAYATLNV